MRVRPATNGVHRALVQCSSDPLLALSYVCDAITARTTPSERVVLADPNTPGEYRRGLSMGILRRDPPGRVAA